MTVGSMTSFLFPLHTGVDQNCFLTVARLWLSGKIPYADICEQKGPLLYLLHIPAALLPSFLGVYFVQIAFWTAILAAFARLCRILSPAMPRKRALLAAAWSALVIVTAYCYSGGDNAEEYCLLPVSISLGDLLLEANREKHGFSWKFLLRSGALAGCVLWVKFSMLGFYLGFCACVGFWALRDGGLREALKSAGVFLLGMAIPTVPILLYFGFAHALGPLLEVYFYDNAVLYPRGRSLWLRIRDYAADLARNPVFFIAIAIGFLALFKGKFSVSKRGGAAAAVTFLTLYLLLYAGGVRYRYYPLILGAFVPTGFAAFFQDAKKPRPKALSAVFLAAYPLLLFAFGNRVRYFFKPLDFYPQIQFAKLIEPGSVLLNYDFLDGGFFLTSGAQPPIGRYFCRLNIPRDKLPEMYEEQERAITGKIADYAVLRKTPEETWEERYPFGPLYENYELRAECSDTIAGYDYRLYEKKP